MEAFVRRYGKVVARYFNLDWIKMSLAIGDIVKLKSGSPLMTVTQLLDGKVSCSWFVESRAVSTHIFPIAALEPQK